jgi:hypothetical protein
MRPLAHAPHERKKPDSGRGEAVELKSRTPNVGMATFDESKILTAANFLSSLDPSPRKQISHLQKARLPRPGRLRGTSFAYLPLGVRVPVCPDSDPDVKTIRQDINKSIDTLQRQVELLAQRLLSSQIRFNELEPRPENTEKLPIRVRRYRLILIR